MVNVSGYHEKISYVRLARRDIQRIKVTLERLEKQLELLDPRGKKTQRREKNGKKR